MQEAGACEECTFLGIALECDATKTRELLCSSCKKQHWTRAVSPEKQRPGESTSEHFRINSHWSSSLNDAGEVTNSEMTRLHLLYNDPSQPKSTPSPSSRRHGLRSRTKASNPSDASIMDDPQSARDNRRKYGRPQDRICPCCDEVLSGLLNLKKHLIEEHRGERPYACRYSGCTRRYSMACYLTAHSKKHKEPTSAARPSGITDTSKPQPLGVSSNPPEIESRQIRSTEKETQVAPISKPESPKLLQNPPRLKRRQTRSKSRLEIPESSPTPQKWEGRQTRYDGEHVLEASISGLRSLEKSTNLPELGKNQIRPRMPEVAFANQCQECNDCDETQLNGMIKCSSETCDHGWCHLGCAKFKDSVSGRWYCSLCVDGVRENPAGLVDKLNNANSENRKRSAPEELSSAFLDDPVVKKARYYFDDMFMSEKDHLQLEDRAISGRMRCIEDLVLQVAGAYTSRYQLVLPGALHFNIQMDAELADHLQNVFGSHPSQESVLSLHSTKARDFVRALLIRIVGAWTFESWYPTYLAPGGTAQSILLAGYEEAERRGQDRFRDAQKRFWRDVLATAAATDAVKDEIATATSWLANQAYILLKLLTVLLRKGDTPRPVHIETGPPPPELDRNLKRLFEGALKLTLEFRTRRDGVSFFWFQPGDGYDSAKMEVKNQLQSAENPYEGRKVQLCLLAGVIRTGDMDDPILSKAVVILEA